MRDIVKEYQKKFRRNHQRRLEGFQIRSESVV